MIETILTIFVLLFLGALIGVGILVAILWVSAED